MGKFIRWCGAVLMIFIWIIGKMLIGEMDRLGKFADFGDFFVVFIYMAWIAICAMLFFWLKPDSEKKEEEEKPIKKLKMERKRQGERRKGKERRE